MTALARPTLAVVAALAGVGLGGPEAGADGPAGVWNAGGGRTFIRVFRCGQATYCGAIVGLKQPRDKNGKIKRDVNNPDPKLRSRPLIGLRLLHALKPTAAGDTWKGTVYNPEDGNTYTAFMALAGKRLKITGCLGVFCRTETWPRVG